MGDGLPRTLNLRDLTLLVIGTVIGSGIFLVPGAVLTQVQGYVLLALLAWVAGGLVSLLGALTYGELSAANPKAGGIYVYIRECFVALPRASSYTGESGPTGSGPIPSRGIHGRRCCSSSPPRHWC